jgi:hypothetical protein
MNDGRKDDQGKPRLDLIPPKALIDLGKVLAYGAEKYGDDNWRKVKDGENRYYAAALRHLLAWRSGEMLDPDSGLPHLSHAMTCLLFLSSLDKPPAPVPATAKVSEPIKPIKVDYIYHGVYLPSPQS